MTRKYSRTAAALAGAAVLSMIATPAMARDRGWGGWGGGWGRHHDRVDAGDVLAGILIIGGIAAIASAASSASKNKRANPEYRDPPPPPQDSRDYGNDSRPQWNEGSGINSAVNRCIDEVSRGKSDVDSVDSVNREGDGWRVQGKVSGGGAFTCTVDGDGRIRNVNIDGRAI